METHTMFEAGGGELCKCDVCGTRIGWESGDDVNGDIWSCEKCGKLFCEKCFIDRHGAEDARRMLCNDCSDPFPDGPNLRETILCPNCFAEAFGRETGE
jgi:hypothetical protein